MRRLLIGGGLSLLMLAALPIAAVATPPQEVQFVLHGNLNPAVTPTWSATGAITDSGTQETGEGILTGVDTPAGTVTFHDQGTLLIGSLGTFMWRLNDHSVSFEFPLLVSEGHWLVTSGTGAYATIHGEGTSTTTVNLITGDIDGVATGQVHFD